MSDCKHIEYLVVKYANITRRKHGLELLKINTGLKYLARRHSSYMARRGKIWHGDNVHQAGKYVHSGFLESIFSFFFGIGGGRTSGENVALMYRGQVRGFKHPIRSDVDIARALHTQWMNSPGHRANILNSQFSKIGVGVKRKGNKYFATEIFYG